MEVEQLGPKLGFIEDPSFAKLQLNLPSYSAGPQEFSPLLRLKTTILQV